MHNDDTDTNNDYDHINDEYKDDYIDDDYENDDDVVDDDGDENDGVTIRVLIYWYFNGDDNYVHYHHHYQ